MAETITTNWEQSAAMTVDLIDEDQDEYLVTRPAISPSDPPTKHKVIISNKYCSCGWWQEYDTPCKDACAVYRHTLGGNISWIYANTSIIYSIETIRNILRKNINPVIIDNITHDGNTKPPKESKKRKPGRPKTVRIRTKRQKTNPENQITCSKCQMKGHNSATCDRRKQLENKTAINEHSFF